MRVRLSELKQVIHEVLVERVQRLEEVDRQKLVKMYRQLGADIKALNINSSKEERDSLRQQVLSFPDQDMAERLSAFLQQKINRLDNAFSHVSGAHRTPTAGRSGGGRIMGIMPSDKRPRRAG